MKFDCVFRYFNNNQYGITIATDDFNFFIKLQDIINNAITEYEKQDSNEKTSTKKSKNSTKE